MKACHCDSSMCLYIYLILCVALCAAAETKQSCSSHMEETDAPEDRTGGQRCGLSAPRTLPGTAGKVRGVIVESLSFPIHLISLGAQ